MQRRPSIIVSEIDITTKLNQEFDTIEIRRTHGIVQRC